MISHKYKCIFIHIPRTGGSTIEEFLSGELIHKQLSAYDCTYKHLTAGYSKILYKDYWDEYFKFAFVRNPWSRMVSLAQFPGFYGCQIYQNGKLNIGRYIRKFPIMELDLRTPCSTTHNKIIFNNCIYKNFIEDEMNFIGKFENYKEDVLFIIDKLKIAKFNFNWKVHKSDRHSTKLYADYYTEETKEQVACLYQLDIEEYKYTF